MEYVNLGRTGLRVSRLCLGTMNFGPEANEDESFRIMDRALELGINFFDTANVYGWKLGEGVTEGILGRWIAQGGGRRENIILATKVYGKMGSGVNDRRLSAYHIRRACEESLIRMQTEYIDVYQMHHIDRLTPWEEIWQAMEQLVREGKVIYIGSSNFAGWQIAQAQEIAHRRNFLGLVSEQSLYNLNARTVELEVLPSCREYGIGVIPWSPLAGGMLAGLGEKDLGGRRTPERIVEWQKECGTQLEAYESFCRELGELPADVAIAWLLKNEAVSAPIIGPRTSEQLNGSLKSLEIELDTSAMERLDEIWPGPGGEAPEAYAW